MLAAGAAYAGGMVNLPAVCDPADTLVELSGAWGAKVVGEDCADEGTRRAVVVLDNDYVFFDDRHDCVVFGTRTDAAIEIDFPRDDTDLTIRTAAAPEDQVLVARRCGPVAVEIKPMRGS